EDCGALLLEDWAEDAPDERHWLRLVALEGQRSSATRLAERAALVAADEARPPALRLQALRALAACGGKRVELTDAAALSRLRMHATARDGASELLDLFGAVVAAPSAEVREAAIASADPRAAAFTASWSLRTGDLAGAEDLLRRSAAGGLASDGEFARWLEVVRDARRVVGVDDARRWIAASLGNTQPDLVQDLSVRANLATPEDERGQAEQLVARERLGERELVRLGALVASPLGTSARDRLLSELERTDEPAARALIAAFDAAAGALRAERRDAELRLLQRKVWEAVRPPAHPLHDALGPDRYPPRVRLEPQRLGAFVRRLGE
ncbi:MAG: hypothetical protein KDC14_06275, partial [Planctomycetes bacterium]|nr:hypothetical protein [Planctomycetota bacterium]